MSVCLVDAQVQVEHAGHADAHVQADDRTAPQPITLTLAQLLHPESWELPDWNGPHAEDAEGTAQTIDDLDRTVSILKRYRNTLRPVHRLTSDLLALIFMDIARDCDTPLESSFGLCSWLYLAHVCHRWRAISLACPSLWTQINTRYPEAALTCLERSADAPLSFVVHSRTVDGWRDVMERMQSHMHRVRHLYVPWTYMRDDDGNIHEKLSPLLDAPAPMLETFYQYRVRSDGNCFALPVIFRNETPRLTSLKLVYAYPELDRLNLTNLRELYIRGRKRDLIAIELSTIMGILAACPSLEVLMTVKTRFLHTQSLEEEGEPLRRIALDSLRRLDIARCEASVVDDFLSRLIIPNCSLRVSVWLERLPDFRFLFGVPKDLDEGHPLRDIRKLHVDYQSGSHMVILEGRTSAHPFQISATIKDPNMGDMPTISGPLLLSIGKTLDLGLLEEFIISESSYYRPHVGFSKDTWTQVLSRMPLLKSLHIRLQNLSDSGFCRVILSALCTPDNVMERMLCPNLADISLTEDRTWSALQWYKFAASRKNDGHPLKHLSLCLPHYENVEDMADTDLAALREVVEEVDLDPPETPDIEFPMTRW